MCVLFYNMWYFIAEDKADCTSGQFYDQDTKNCKVCEFTSGTLYSEDGAEECKLCPDNGANCSEFRTSLFLFFISITVIHSIDDITSSSFHCYLDFLLNRDLSLLILWNK